MWITLTLHRLSDALPVAQGSHQERAEGLGGPILGDFTCSWPSHSGKQIELGSLSLWTREFNQRDLLVAIILLPVWVKPHW